MKKNISLIITEEYSAYFEKLVHFKIENYYIIPLDVDWIEFYLLSENGQDYENLDEIFEKVIDQLYNSDTFGGIFSNQNKHPKPVFQDILSFENLLLVEILKKLKIKNFELYHYSENEQNERVYWNEFIDGVLDYYACEKFMDKQNDSIWNNPKFDAQNYPNYEYCKVKFMENQN